MDAAGILERFERTHARWRAALEPLDDGAFLHNPDGGGWCVGQVCHHVASVSDFMLEQAEACARGEGETRRFSFLPVLITLVGSLPPVRIRIPPLPDELAHLADPAPLNRTDALARLDGMAERMRAAASGVSAASPRCRRQHPAGGWPHARQWYQFNEMHFRHHLRQLRRLGVTAAPPPRREPRPARRR